MIQAEREGAAEQESDGPAPDCAEEEREPVHPRAAPTEDERSKERIVKILESRIGLEDEIAVEHAANEEDGSSPAEAVRPLQGRIRSKADYGHEEIRTKLDREG